MADDSDPPKPPSPGGEILPFARRARKGGRGAKLPAPRAFGTQAEAEMPGLRAAHDGALAAFEDLDIEGEIDRAQRAVEAGQPGAALGLAEVRIARAIRSFGRGDVDGALAELGEVIAEHPTLADGYRQRAGLHQILKNTAEAVADFGSLAELEPTNADAYRQRAAGYATLGDHARAIANYRRAAQLDPANGSILHGMGDAYNFAGDRDGAIRAYGRAIKYEPNNPNHYLSRGLMREGERRWEAAIADYDKSLALFANQVSVRICRARCLMYLERHEPALAETDRALKAWPNDACAHSMRGQVLLALGRHAEARAALERSLALDPKDTPTRWLLGRVLDEQGDLAGALEAFDAAVAASPNTPSFLMARFAASARAGRGEGLRADLVRLVELCPDVVEIAWSHAKIARKEGDVDTAFAELTRAIGLDPAHAPSFHERAAIHRDRGAYAAAAEDEARAAAIEPENAEYRSWLGLYRSAPGSSPESALAGLADLDAAVALAPDNVMVWGRRGNYHASHRDQGAAARDFRRAAELDPSSSHVHYLLAQALYGGPSTDDWEERNEEALRAIDRAIELKHEPEQELDLYDLRSSLRSDMDDYAGSLADLDRVIALDPEPYWYRFEARAYLRGEVGDAEGAARDRELAKELLEKARAKRAEEEGEGGGERTGESGGEREDEGSETTGD